MDNDIKQIEQILSFWFGDLDGDADLSSRTLRARDSLRESSRDFAHCAKFDASKNTLWWKGQAADDALITERFGDLVQQALAGKLRSWSDSPRGSLALVLLCDQLTRSSGRGTAEAFAGDETALRVCLDAIDRGFDRQLRLIERTFLYMPLMHAEDRDMAALSVKIYTELSAAISEAGVSGFPDSLSHAVQHADIVTRFGRYPHRNALLGRDATAEELAYLDAGAPTFGQQNAETS